MELYCDISQLDVMSNLEIDAAKRENPADNAYELRCLKKKYDRRDNKGRHIRPLFFKYIDGYKGFRSDYHLYSVGEDNEYNKCFVSDKYSDVRQYMSDTEKNVVVERGRMSYEMYQTTMDYLQKAIDKFSNKRLPKKPLINFADVLIPLDSMPGYVKYPQAQRLLDTIKDTKMEIWKIWNCREDLSPSKKRKLSYEIKQELVEYISTLMVGGKTIRYILSLIDTEEYKNIRQFIFDIILDTSNAQFYELITMSKEPILRLEEDENGDVDIMGFKYKYV